MSSQKIPAVTLFSWLKKNCGPKCLAPLTSGDVYALRAAVQVVELWSYSRNMETERAFGLLVYQMQPHTRFLAFHAIAHVCDWGHRAQLWALANLPAMPEKFPGALYGPEGLERRRAMQARGEDV